jgi:capsular exopolysaccharide synthesis family protein
MNLLASRPDGVVRTLMFTSPLAGDGKTTTAVNYALALAGRGYRTLLIDADLRRGVVHSLFGLAPEPGLSSVLTRGEVLETACRKVAIERGHTLDVLPRGAVPPNSGGVLASEAFSALIADAARRYDRIVIDTPPLNAVADAALVSAHVDGVVVVVRAGVTSPDAIGYMMEQLRTVRAPVLGAVLNDMDFRHDAAYNGAYEYYADPGPSAVAPSA